MDISGGRTMGHTYPYFSEIFIIASINKHQHKLEWENLNMSALLLTKQYKYLGEKQGINILEGKNEPEEQDILRFNKISH